MNDGHALTRRRAPRAAFGAIFQKRGAARLASAGRGDRRDRGLDADLGRSSVSCTASSSPARALTACRRSRSTSRS